MFFGLTYGEIFLIGVGFCFAVGTGPLWFPQVFGRNPN